MASDTLQKMNRWDPIQKSFAGSNAYKKNIKEKEILLMHKLIQICQLQESTGREDRASISDQNIHEFPTILHIKKPSRNRSKIAENRMSSKTWQFLPRR